MLTLLRAGRMVGEWVEREALSTGLGIASICVWLFAQSPQVIQNWRSGSVEGASVVHRAPEERADGLFTSICRSCPPFPRQLVRRGLYEPPRVSCS